MALNLGVFATTPSSYETHRDILANDSGAVISTYTLDQDYVTPVTLVDAESTTRKVLYEGQVLQYDPSTRKVVPAYASYGFTAAGVLLQYADAQNADSQVAVVVHGDVYEDYCTDNGTFGTVTAQTKTDLSGRVYFRDEIDANQT